MLMDTTAIAASIASVCILFLAFYAVVVKRNELFKGSIYSKQIDELISIRHRIQSIWFQIYYSHFWSLNLISLKRSIVEFQQEQPGQWVAYSKFQDDCRYVFYAFSHGENGLFPNWFKPKDHQDLLAALNRIVPFTFHALSGKTSEEIQVFQNLLLRKISDIDASLNKQA